MSRRKNDFFDDLASRIFATVGDQSLTGPRKANALGFIKIGLELAHNRGVQDGLDEAKKIIAKPVPAVRGQEPAQAEAAE